MNARQRKRMDAEQTKAIRAIRKTLDKEGRALVEMATGTGKTATYVKFLKQYLGRKSA